MVLLIGTNADQYKITPDMGIDEKLQRMDTFYRQSRHIVFHTIATYLPDLINRSGRHQMVSDRSMEDYNKIVDIVHPKMQDLDVQSLEGDVAAIMHKMGGNAFVDKSLNNSNFGNEFETVSALYDRETGNFKPDAKEEFFRYLNGVYLGRTDKKKWSEDRKNDFIQNYERAFDLLERLFAIQISEES